jgi:hypothetical protein
LFSYLRQKVARCYDAPRTSDDSIVLHGPTITSLATCPVDHSSRNPLVAPAAVFLIALSLSIGWGIRGNFGHEAGAMIAGVLSATAVAVLSGRDDWRNRAAYFALFGGLGWGFGGSIAYMYPISFTESGHTVTTYYGYFALFLEGGLWCGMGAAGTALAATMPLHRLARLFAPLCFVLAAMALRIWIEAPLESLLAPPGAGTGDATWHRHESPLYWFDADWLPACMALLGVCAFDLFDRLRHERPRLLDSPTMLLPFAAGGAAIGYSLQSLVRAGGFEEAIHHALVVKLGDLSYVNPATGNHFDADQLLTNWPQFFSDYPQHLGWGIGLVCGAAVYFVLTGKFRNDASLFVYLSLGWLAAFLALPVLGSTLLMDYGGLRVMPPRSDDWAGIVGVFVAGLIWSRRHGLAPIAHVMSFGFILGGIAFATVPMIRYFLRYPGHPWRYPEGVPEAFAHYQSANWHSILEQMHGFGHGLAIAVAMALLWRRQPDEPRATRVGGLAHFAESAQQNVPVPLGRNNAATSWTVAFSVWFVWFAIGFLNLHKLVETWVTNGAVPPTLKAPLLGFIEATPLVWFNVVWWTAAAVCALLLIAHRRQPLDIVPTSWTGKGQLIFVVFLWLMVVGNVNRAIPGFSNGRMVTEWILFMNASLATLLILLLPNRLRPLTPDTRHPTPAPAWPSLTKTWLCGLTAAAVLICLYGYLTLAIYQPHLAGKPWANHRRFGPEAKWRIEPILKQGKHP